MTPSFPHVRKPTCIDGFCGAGGMSSGLVAAGYDVKLAFDVDAAAVRTYGLNFGGRGRVLDAFLTKGSDLLEMGALERGEIDLFCGGPPCQGFSRQRRGAHVSEDPRNGLVAEFARLVDEMLPKTFLFENVEAVAQKRGRREMDAFKDGLRGYRITDFTVDAADFGIAQRRTRFLLVGIRNDVGAGCPVLRRSETRRTVRDVIADLPSPPADGSDHPDFPGHRRSRISAENIARIATVPRNGGWRDIPEHLRLPCHRRSTSTSGGWPDSYGRLGWDGQAPTITAGFDSFSRGRYAHPEENRPLTLREGARLQGFDDGFRFCGSRRDIRRQIGNAVPPPLARAFGDSIIRACAEK